MSSSGAALPWADEDNFRKISCVYPQLCLCPVTHFSLVLEGAPVILPLIRISRMNIKNQILHTMKARKNSGFTLVEIMIVVVIIGLLAAMAIPAFQKVRANSQDKAVTNNLRQLSSAADQYFLENGVTTVASSLLVGTDSTQYVKVINTVARETYSTNLTQGQPVSATGVAGVRTISYAN
jgi:type IV pilus assembly protein PilA